MIADHDIDCLEEGDPERVIQLLGSRDNLHLEDDNTPMHVAAYFGNVNLLVALIKHYPVHIDAINRYGWTPLMQAAREGHYNVVEALLATGADPSICNLLGVNALGVATRGGHDKIVDLLLDHDAHVTKGLISDEIYDGIINPLHVAIVLSRDDMLKVLLRRGFHPNCRNRFTHWTPTMTTAIAGEICTARILFKERVFVFK